MDPTFVFVVIVVWVASLIVTARIAPEARVGTFMLVALFLGPIAMGFAAIAPREAVLPGRTLRTCIRCAAVQYTPNGESSFECWRCHEHVQIESRPRRSLSDWAAPEPAESGSTTPSGGTIGKHSTAQAPPEEPQTKG